MQTTNHFGDDHILVVRPLLNSAPTFYRPDWWTESAHMWDGTIHEGPASEKPSATFEVSIDVTLGSVLDAACSAWGFAAGIGQTGISGRSMYAHVGFVTPRQETETITSQESYTWRGKVPVLLEDGSDVQIVVHDVTYRQLLASSALELIDGDVTRPIIQLSIPQGVGGSFPELVEYAKEIAPAIYAEIDAFFGHADHIIKLIAATAPTINRVVDDEVDEGVRIAAVATMIAKLRERFSKK